MGKVCEWHEEDAESNCWDTTCGEVFQLNHDTPAENNMRFCCYCGGALEQVPYGSDDGDDE